MEATDLLVAFPEHMQQSRIDGLLSGIAAYGNVGEGGQPRTYRVSVFRASKLPQLAEQLTTWERHGFLTWQRAA